MSSVAVVTGAGSGLGRAVACALAERGHELVLVGRRDAELEATRELAGGGALVVPADVSVPAQVEALHARARAERGHAEILVNGAGVFGPFALVAESDPEQWIATLMVNTVAPYLTCRAFLPGMLAAGRGRIVNVSSAGALYPPGPFNSAYATAKAALNRFTRHLAAEVAGTGVTANVVHPGSLRTAMFDDIKAQVEAAGERATAFREWVALVEQTGGDPVAKGVDVVLRAIDGDANGEFLWPDDALEPPLPTW
jgi:NAD(P)-dependent dehydrogenase (short-subunit alcohol dehydrogenase family)